MKFDVTRLSRVVPISSLMDHMGVINYLNDALNQSRTRSMVLWSLYDLMSLSHRHNFQIKSFPGQVPSPSMLATSYL